MSLAQVLAANPEIAISVPPILVYFCLAYMLCATASMSIKLSSSRPFAVQGICAEVKQKNQLLSDHRKDVGSCFARYLLKFARQTLSQFSVEYVLGLTDLGADPAVRTLSAQHVNVDHLKRMCMPFYSSMKLLLDAMLKLKIPAVVNVRRVNAASATFVDRVVVIYNIRDGMYENRMFDTRAAVVFEGVSIGAHAMEPHGIFLNRLVSVSLYDLVMCNFATHSNFPGVKEVSSLAGELSACASRAMSEGLCKLNPEICGLYHAYCDTIGKQVQIIAQERPLPKLGARNRRLFTS